MHIIMLMRIAEYYTKFFRDVSSQNRKSVIEITVFNNLKKGGELCVSM